MKQHAAVYLLLGSNLGNRIQNLKEATDALSQHFKITNSSKTYETEAWGKTDQGTFLNQVLAVETDESPTKVLQICQQIEQKLGRVRKEKWGERTMDIDILYFDSQIVNLPNLLIPHPQIQFRKFTLIPLAEIAPNLKHPTLKLSQMELLNQCSDNSKVIEHLPLNKK